MMTRAPLALLAACALAAVASTAPVRAGQADALARVTPGAYLLSERDGADRRICVAEPARVLRVAHAAGNCSQAVLARSSSGLTVDYTCPGAGVGRTQLTAYTAGRFRLRTQGIARGAPFDRQFEASRIGDCAPAR